MTGLPELETYLQNKRKRVAKSLLPGASEDELSALGKALARPLRPELLAWFSWHNGQKKAVEGSLLAGTEWSAMTVPKAVKAWQALRDLKASGDLLEPWELGWFPLFDDGGGNHVVLDLDSGQVLEWFHDDPDRPVLAPSLEALLAGCIASYEEEALAKLPRLVEWHPDTAVPLSDSLARHLDRAPLGTVIWGGPARLLAGVPGIPDPPLEYLVMLRSHPRWTWTIGRSGQSLADCQQKISTQLAESGSPDRYHSDVAASNWLSKLLNDPEGRQSARQGTATVTVQVKKKR